MSATRVLLLSHTAELGGAELALLRLAEALGPEIHLRVALFSDGELRRRLEATGIGVEVIELEPDLADLGRYAATRPGIGRFARYLGFTWRLARRIRRVQPDVVATASLKSDLLGTVAALIARRPCVWYVHDRISADYLPGLLVRLVRWMSRLPTAVIVNSRATAATLPVGTVVAYPGFSPDQVRGQRKYRPETTVVGLVGRISPTKGQLELVRAARAVLDRHPSATFRIIGGPLFGAEEYAASVRAEAVRLGVDVAFTWVGFTDDVATEIDRCTVVVHASPVPEPFGQVVVEAMIRGVPVVATRAGGVPEIVEHNGDRLGILVEPGDIASLAEGINEVLDDLPAARTRADHARLVAIDRFSVARTASTVSGVWRSAARGR